MVVLRDRRIVCVGGWDDGYNVLKTVVVFDFTTNKWASLPDLPSLRADHGTVVLADNRIVCVGGEVDESNILKTVVVFDFTTNKWSSLPDMPSPRVYHGTVVLADNRIVCVGGEDDEDNYLKTVVVFDFTTNKWASLPDLPASRTLLRAAVTPDGQLVCAGGAITTIVATAVAYAFDFPFWTMERHCSTPSVLSPPARTFVLFIMFIGEAMDRPADAPAGFTGDVVEMLPPDVWLLILSFLRLTELRFALPALGHGGGGGGGGAAARR